MPGGRMGDGRGSRVRTVLRVSDPSSGWRLAQPGRIRRASYDVAGEPGPGLCNANAKESRPCDS
jgi:hypothetical protein